MPGSSTIANDLETSSMPTHPTVPDYVISTDKQRLDIGVIHRFLAEESYWSPGIPRDVVERSIENSLCFGVYDGEQQIGFARIVTDKSTFALVADVFILDSHRGQGLSRRLMQSIMEHADLQGLRRLLLLTSDAHGLYKKFGFDEIGNAWRFMEILRPDIYKSA
jgi:N-acetylglutamate synthase-like GNAT family acetyltransferase